ncbi:uncharacterized protein LOC114747239 [Neltuma alba]|uniref:uncharacterized protein LOC114747239 n=1 Tax=Neltuma alba TaxID=207710 RepID=UPI0010A49FB8|nr:uncharacterized protein LOC114747239 [Prosopis alba]
MEGLKVSDANLVVYVHPSKSNKVHQAVLNELSTLLFTFSEIFDGVVLAYDVNFLEKCAKVLSGVHPYFGVTLKAKLLLFSPKPNMLLEAKVVKLTQESIHAIVLGFSSAVIADKDIREEFTYRNKHGQGRYISRLHKRHVIKVGTMIRFEVKSFDEEILHVFGSLKLDTTGGIHWLDKNLEDVPQSDRSAKKKRENEGESLILEQNAMVEEPIFLDNAHAKKPKKQRIKEES